LSTLQGLETALQQAHTSDSVIRAVEVVRLQLEGLLLYVTATSIAYDAAAAAGTGTSPTPLAAAAAQVVLPPSSSSPLLEPVALNDTHAAYTHAFGSLLSSCALERARAVANNGDDGPSLDWPPCIDQMALVLLEVAQAAWRFMTLPTPAASASDAALARNAALQMNATYEMDLTTVPAPHCECSCDELFVASDSSSSLLSAVAVPVRCFPVLSLSLLSEGESFRPRRGAAMLGLARTWRLLGEDAQLETPVLVAPGAASTLAQWHDSNEPSSSNGAAPGELARAWYAALAAIWNTTDTSLTVDESAIPAREEVRVFLRADA